LLRAKFIVLSACTEFAIGGHPNMHCTCT